MPFYQLETLSTRDLFPGFAARLVHTPRMTLSFVEGIAGSAFPEHQHPHEQVVVVLAGELEVTVPGETLRLTPGMVYAIPPDVPHSGRAVTDCRILDTFAPSRDDYR